MCFLDSITLDVIKEVVTTVTLGVGAYVAWSGLSTWKNQIKGGHQYNIAKNLLLNTYYYKEAMFGLRSQVIWNSEYPLIPAAELILKSEFEIKYINVSYAYLKRWERVEKLKPIIYGAILECQVIWGNELRVLYDKIFKLERKVFVEIGLYLDALKNEILDKESVNYKLINDSFDDANDLFRKDFNPLLEQIEKFIKPKLKL